MLRQVTLVVASLVLASGTAIAQNASVTLMVTDMGLQNGPIPGVNVRVTGRGGRMVDMGATDGQGAFKTNKVMRGETITFEYGLAGYVRRPERQAWKVVGPSDTVNGTLISSTNQSPAYLRAIAEVIDAMAANAPEDAKKLEYTDLWQRVAELPKPSQQVVGRELDGKKYLVDVASFQNAIKDERTGGGTRNAK